MDSPGQPLRVGIVAMIVMLAATCGSASAQQAQPDPMMARMRDALKKLTQRVTDSESQMVTAQAAQIAAEAQVKELTAKLDAANKQLKQTTTQAADDKANAESKIDALEQKLQSRDKTIVQYADALAKWKAGFEQAQKVANAKEGERVEAVGRAIELERRVVAHDQKNREMYRLATEILDRYKSFGLGTALMAREPFVGSMRVKFQNYMQDYGDKLDTQKIGTDQPGAVVSKPN
ncbi:MAG: hypothetical protein U0984_12480 [Prosthecobacter sp.]|nr:hypothetical protein [Prosthecobacter sp.]